MILLNGDGANPGWFAISARNVIAFASTLHITFNFSLKVIFYLVFMSKIAKSNHKQYTNK